ncbi:MAG TPA: PilX N-terminal domain-containing pilus assembly protein [Steroidobacteraceae bacterium]|jgi:type IV pilus assembly protein PilX
MILSIQAARQKQRGVVLITAMLLLIVVTIMALSMFRSYGVEERLAGNTRDKQRAINAAVSAQQYAEFSLASGTAPISGTCAPGILPTGIEVCKAPLLPLPAIDFTVLPWVAGVTYTQFTNSPINGVSNIIRATGTFDTAAASASYVQAPIFYITDLGPNALGAVPQGEVYQVDAVGYGGSSNTVAVVESTFVIGTSTPTPL